MLARPYRHECLIDKLPASEVGWKSRALHRIKFDVLHRCLVGETPEETATFFVEQMGWPANPYHFGVFEDSDGPIVYQNNRLRDLTYGVAGLNARSLHIMIHGDFRKTAPSDALFYGAAALCADLLGFGRGTAIRGHSESTLWLPKKYQTSKKCPGDAFDLRGFRRVVDRVLQGNEEGLPVLPVGSEWWKL